MVLISKKEFLLELCVRKYNRLKINVFDLYIG